MAMRMLSFCATLLVFSAICCRVSLAIAEASPRAADETACSTTLRRSATPEMPWLCMERARFICWSTASFMVLMRTAPEVRSA